MVPYGRLGQLERDKDDVFVALCEIARQWVYDESAPPSGKPLSDTFPWAQVRIESRMPNGAWELHAGTCPRARLGCRDGIRCTCGGADLPEARTCQECAGRGDRGGLMSLCEACNGTGKVWGEKR